MTSDTKTKVDFWDEAVKKILSDPEYDTVCKFVTKKTVELRPISPKNARKWLIRLLKVWSGPSTWEEIAKNQRKMELVYKCWKNHFFGYGLEIIPKFKVLNDFRTMVRKELLEMNARAQYSRQKHLGKSPVIDVYSDDDAIDYCSMEAAKLSNMRTCNKNINPQKSAVPLKRTSEHDPNKPRGVMKKYPRRVSDLHVPGRRISFGYNSVCTYNPLTPDSPPHSGEDLYLPSQSESSESEESEDSIYM